MRTAIKAQGTALAFGKFSQAVQRKIFELKRGRGPRIVHYFHRVDDPVCQLLVQVLPELQDRFDITIQPHVVEQLDAKFFPAPERYEAHAILDCGRVAALYGLGFPGNARVPDRLGVGMASRFLASLEQDKSFFEAATEIGEALWRYDIGAVRKLSGMADMSDTLIQNNQQLLRKLGHWESGTLIYEGESYRGISRLDHLENRLNAEGAGDSKTKFNLGRDLFAVLGGDVSSLEGKELELFWSARSPYSYLALERAAHFAARAGMDLVLRPVLPMVVRGMQLPSLKKWTIVQDTAREARMFDIPFGAIADPLGGPLEKALATGMALHDDERDLTFFRAWSRNTWSRGNNGQSQRGWQQILNSSGLGGWRLSPLDRETMNSHLARNREDLGRIGAWGVPTFKVGHQMFWGQDRLWAALKALAEQS